MVVVCILYLVVEWIVVSKQRRVEWNRVPIQRENVFVVSDFNLTEPNYARRSPLLLSLLFLFCSDFLRTNCHAALSRGASTEIVKQDVKKQQKSPETVCSSSASLFCDSIESQQNARCQDSFQRTKTASAVTVSSYDWISQPLKGRWSITFSPKREISLSYSNIMLLQSKFWSWILPSIGESKFLFPTVDLIPAIRQKTSIETKWILEFSQRW